MKSVRLFFAFGIILALIIVAWFWKARYVAHKNPDPNHTHADFAVYVSGRKIDFSQSKYMSLSAAEIAKAGTGSQLSTYLHLHDGNGNVLHSHKQGFTIGDFFATLKMPIVGTCMTIDTGEKLCAVDDKKWRLFVNDSEVPFDGLFLLHDLDRILLTYGSADGDVTAQLRSVTHDACLYSLTCPERGQAPKENCIADPDVPCVDVDHS